MSKQQTARNVLYRLKEQFSFTIFFFQKRPYSGMCKQSNTTPSKSPGSQKLFPRKCDVCSKGMCSGYVIGGGEKYFCSDECLHQEYTKKEWEQLYAEGTSDSYYTEWTEEDIDPDDEPIFETNPE